MKLTLKKAFELSIEKWEMIVKNNGDHPDKYPKEITCLINKCGLCEYNEPRGPDMCNGCPINCGTIGVYGVSCNADEHLYTIWSDDRTKANAQAVLDLINEKYAVHLKRYYHG